MIPEAECWKNKPSYEDYLNDLLHDFSKESTKVYQRSDPRRPLDNAPFVRVLAQLSSPDAVTASYATNMNSSLAQMQIPERLAAPLYFDEDRHTTTNITPKFVFIDLHIDPLSHGITTSFGNCVKLWALYPPTDADVRLFLQSRHIMNNFVHLANRLQGGEFCITTEKVALYIPPGCLHATYTLAGGLTPGIQYTTAQCLCIAKQVWEVESRVYSVRKVDCGPYLRAIKMGLLSTDSETRGVASDFFCEKYRYLKKATQYYPLFRDVELQIRTFIIPETITSYFKQHRKPLPDESLPPCALKKGTARSR
ncbi:hypothetical protein PG985_005559 [Apiospora marii]|uniref:uncharacterized protein n=1 Tax=Apiospora marii TaxID=335849 RepID=UPI00312CDA14